MVEVLTGLTERITARRFHETVGLEDWRVVGEGACTYFRTGSFAAGVRLVGAIGELAGLDEHHPDVDLRAAGGHLVTDEYAPSWWVLADAEGNEVCVCTPTSHVEPTA